MLHMTLVLEDIIVAADRTAALELDELNPDGFWTLKISNPHAGKEGKIRCTDYQLSCLMFVAHGGGGEEMEHPSLLAEESHLKMVQGFYDVVEPLFKDLPKELRFFP